MKPSHRYGLQDHHRPVCRVCPQCHQRLLPARPTFDLSGCRTGFIDLTETTNCCKHIDNYKFTLASCATNHSRWLFPILDKQYFDESSGQGIDGGAELSVDPDLQERSDLSCDNGSSILGISKVFSGLSFDDLGEEWLKKSGRYALDDDAVREHVKRMRKTLFETAEGLDNGNRKDIVVVTHGVFMKFFYSRRGYRPAKGWVESLHD